MDSLDNIWPGWKIECELGAGAFGKVYLVSRSLNGITSLSAVKIIHIPQSYADIRDMGNIGMDDDSIRTYYQDIVDSLMDEISIMESLKSADNIVSIEDYAVEEKPDEIGWTIYIRMEQLLDLGSYIREFGEMSEEEVVKLGCDICQALICCEQVNIIHRDIKLDNVFVNKFGSFKLGDFGISKQLEKTTSALSQKGTNMYMAPEIFRGEKYGHTVDIYALGTLLYRLLNEGRFPFVPTGKELRYSDSQVALKRRFSGDVPDKPLHCSKELWRIIRKAIDYNPERRYRSAADMLEELRQCGDLRPQTVDPKTDEVLFDEDWIAEWRKQIKNRTSDKEDATVWENDEIEPERYVEETKGDSRFAAWIFVFICILILAGVGAKILYDYNHPNTEGTNKNADATYSEKTDEDDADNEKTKPVEPAAPSSTSEATPNVDKLNKAADAVYMKEFEKYVVPYYMFADVTGDGIHEAIFIRFDKDYRGCVLSVYSYEDDGLVDLINEEVSATFPGNVQIYEKAKVLVLSVMSGDGTESYYYYDKLGDRYVSLAARGGSNYDGLGWNYIVDGKEVSKSVFKNAIRSLQDETPVTLNNWETKDEM